MYGGTMPCHGERQANEGLVHVGLRAEWQAGADWRLPTAATALAQFGRPQHPIHGWGDDSIAGGDLGEERRLLPPAWRLHRDRQRLLPSPPPLDRALPAASSPCGRLEAKEFGRLFKGLAARFQAAHRERPVPATSPQRLATTPSNGWPPESTG